MDKTPDCVWTKPVIFHKINMTFYMRRIPDLNFKNIARYYLNHTAAASQRENAY